MEKNEKKCNLLMWTVIYMLPLIIYIIQSFNGSPDLVELISIHGITTNNFIYDIIMQVFSLLDINLIANNSAIVLYLTYFIVLNIVHIIVDLLVLLPRVAQTFSDKICNSGD